MEPLPSTGISKVLSLCEILDDHGGRENLFRLGQDLHMALGELLLLVKGAQMLKLAEMVGDDTVLTPLGKQLLGAGNGEKKLLLRQQMLQLNLFKHIVALLEQKGNQVPVDVIVEVLAMLLPQEQPRQLFTTLLNWGRYGEIFGYSRDTDQVHLEKPAP